MGSRARTVVTVEEGESPLFLRIARGVADDIRRGRLRAGDALPGTRTLAETLGVNRNTAVAAFRELAAEGWVITRSGGGTFVADDLPEMKARLFARVPRPSRVAAAAAFPMTRSGAPAPDSPPPPGVIPMWPGVPDVRLVPVDLLTRALRRALTSRAAAQLLRYGDPRGDERLRAAIAGYMRETRGVPATIDDVLVLQGSQMAFELVARATVPAGAAVAVEDIGYRPAWGAFARAGAAVAPVPLDASGIDVTALSALVQRRRIAAVYLTPHHQYPTMVTLTPARRIALLDLARRARLAVIEDDSDHELHYEGRPVLPLASADVHGSVVYLGTLSKVLAPGLRLGYVVAPRPLIERLAAERALVDRHGNHAVERAVAELFADGEIARHLRRMRRVYASRRDLLVSELSAALGDRVDLRIPSGGMALWVRVRLPGRAVAEWECRALDAGAAFAAGHRFAFDARPLPYARFGFAALSESEIREGVRRASRAFPR